MTFQKAAKCFRVGVILVALATGSCANESAAYCEASRELDFSSAGLPPGSWICPFGASVDIDTAGKPRRLALNPVQEHTFGCSSQMSLPLVLRDPNVQSGFGDARELVEHELRAGYVNLIYDFIYHGGHTTTWRYFFRVEPNGQLSYARTRTSDINWQFCVDHPVSGKDLGTSEDETAADGSDTSSSI